MSARLCTRGGIPFVAVFVMIVLAGCVVQATTAPEPPSPSGRRAATAPPPAPTQEQVSYAARVPGLEPGFMHCCGDTEYMMEVDCSERLMRCYSNTGDHWKQTYGRHCKQNLGQACYLEACVVACEGN